MMETPLVIISLREYENLIEVRDNNAKTIQQFHTYCATYLMPQAWGKNVYKAVLEDAQRMRDESTRVP